MSSQALAVLDLAIRWVHVIAAIMWVGNSLLFNFLDRVLRPSSKPGEGMQGDLWLIHSGGFYFLEKTLLVGQPLPRPLHWFKWQAYATWISGATLLVFVYYIGGRTLLLNPARAGLSPWGAVAVGVLAIALGWIIYDLAWRLVAPRSTAAAAVISLAALLLEVLALTHLLSGRAAFIHVGAMLGTIMAGNVAMTIMPSQSVLVAAVREGRGADPVVADRAKTRSIHNNYLTFPVIALMLISHFPAVYGHRLSWLLLLLIIAVGAAVRHILNIRFSYRAWVPALATTIGVFVAVLYALLRFGDTPVVAASPAATAVSFSEARHVIDRRCAACHSQNPSDLTFGPMPGGVAFDTPEQIQALASRILERAVVTRTMPPANNTRITDEERELLGRWVRSLQK